MTPSVSWLASALVQLAGRALPCRTAETAARARGAPSASRAGSGPDFGAGRMRRSLPGQLLHECEKFRPHMLGHGRKSGEQAHVLVPEVNRQAMQSPVA